MIPLRIQDFYDFQEMGESLLTRHNNRVSTFEDTGVHRNLVCWVGLSYYGVQALSNVVDTNVYKHTQVKIAKIIR